MSDSVTGSEPELTDAELELLSITRIQGKPREWMVALRDVQREAVDAFIRDELPGLLTEALRQHWPIYDGSVPSGFTGGPFDMAAPELARAIADKIAELRK